MDLRADVHVSNSYERASLQRWVLMLEERQEMKGEAWELQGAYWE